MGTANIDKKCVAFFTPNKFNFDFNYSCVCAFLFQSLYTAVKYVLTIKELSVFVVD
jgi:hypothetical protein